MLKKKKNDEDYHRPRIGVDLLGCDTPPRILLEAIIKQKWDEEHPPKITVYGDPEVFETTIVPEDILCEVVTEVITMDDDPLLAVRRKKHSSLAIGIHQLKEYEIDAFVTGGNSGALLAQSMITLEKLPGIDRPAFLTMIPTKLEPIAVLDVGANVEASAEHLLQFAQMGMAYQKSRGNAKPKVGLLNIGEEKKKGTHEVRQAYELLQKLNLQSPVEDPTFLGNIEGRNVFHGEIDVLVTNGFTGNVFLKTAQGIAGFILEQMQDLGPLEMIPGLKSILRTLRHRLHYAEYSGALLCGINGIVIKCHGESPPESFLNSIHSAARLVKNSFLENIKEELPT